MPRHNKWTGHYVQNDEEKEMIFESLAIDEDGIEAVGTDAAGDFEITGNLEDGRVRFEKKYDGWTVFYYGEVSENDNKIEGFWGF